MAKTDNSIVIFKGKKYSDWASLRKGIEAAGINVLEWVQKNPNKAAVLGAGTNATGDRVATGYNATRYKQGTFVNRVGMNSGIRGEDGNMLTTDEVKAMSDARVASDTVKSDAAASAASDTVTKPYVDQADERLEVDNERRARDAAAAFIDGIVDFGLAEGFDIQEIIEGFSPAVQTILNQDYGGGASILSLIEGSSNLSFLAEMDRAIENLQANKASITRDFTVGKSRLSRDLGLGEDRLETLNGRALRNIADAAGARGIGRSGIKNRFDTEQGEDHEFALSEFQNAINDASVDLANQTADAIRNIDYNLGELDVDKGRGIRDFGRSVEDLQQGVLDGNADAVFQHQEDLLSIADIPAVASFNNTYQAPVVETPTLEDLGLSGVPGSPFGGGFAPAPSGEAISGADPHLGGAIPGNPPKKKKKKKTAIANLPPPA